MHEQDEFEDWYAESADEEQPYWTARRVIWLVLALLIIAALLASMLWPFLQQMVNPLPPPPTPPFGRI